MLSPTKSPICSIAAQTEVCAVNMTCPRLATWPTFACEAGSSRSRAMISSSLTEPM